MRHLLTRWGEVPLRWPRFVCECGGSITLDLDDWLRPYQRIGSDVDAQIQRWGALSVSLRAMQGELPTATWACWASAPCSSACINSST